MKLNRAQRSALFAGTPVKLAFPGNRPCPVEVGHVEVLSNHVKLEVTDIRRAKSGEHVLVYTLHNNRLGQRFLARHGDECGYSHTAGSDVDTEAGEAVDAFTQKRISDAAREREQKRAQEVILAVEDVRQAIRDRMENNPEFRGAAGRSLYRITAELERMMKNAKRHAA